MKRYITLAIVAAVLFACLAVLVQQGAAGRFDLAVRGWVHAWASPHLTFEMLGITWLGSAVLLVPLGALLAWRLAATGRRREAVLLILAALGGEALNQGLKVLFERPRPEAFFELPQPDSYSFPSGHSMSSACFYGALAMIARRRAAWAGMAVVVVLVGLSRIYLGVHFPTDVLGGYLAAVAWLAVLQATLRSKARSTFLPPPPVSRPPATPGAM